MRTEQAQELLQQRLTALGATTAGVETWKAYLLSHPPQPNHPDDAYAWLTCALALSAVAAGNFGVGAILADGDEQVVAQGHNQVFRPHFRSDRHAEMVVLDEWEDAQPPQGSALTLYTSLEPCPMCLVRLSTSAVREVRFAAPDGPGGMVSRMDSLPPFWAELARRKAFGPARCSPELTHAAGQIFLLNLRELTARVNAV